MLLLVTTGPNIKGFSEPDIFSEDCSKYSAAAVGSQQGSSRGPGACVWRGSVCSPASQVSSHGGCWLGAASLSRSHAPCHDMSGPSDARHQARLPASPSPGARPAAGFQRSDSTRISIGRGRSRASVKAPPSPLSLSRVPAVSAPASPSAGQATLRARPSQLPAPVGRGRGRGRPTSLPSTAAGPAYTPPHTNGGKKVTWYFYELSASVVSTKEKGILCRCVLHGVSFYLSNVKCRKV